ncbi:PIN-like domain-containing protein [Pseudomonas sp. D(2018)]|uniref:PIN-like domain-containing protein n=1 Tax=Pseudomonas sp. D(2018) TaxID=2502238 RepID=UPI0010F6AA7A|nr:PIN-like domain-containing protein [Pseudomonas sp. D(2018)]
MRSMFPGYFASESVDFSTLWDECLFVLDANILLNLYRYSDATRSALVDVLEAYGDRLWVPNRAAEEFLNNRLDVIDQQKKKYDSTISDVERLRRELDNSRQHPFVSMEVLSQCYAAFDALVGELSINREVHSERVVDDDIKSLIVKLLDGKVGEPYEKSVLEQILEEGAARYKQKIPPGYSDFKVKSGDAEVFSERCRPFGDLIVWKQIIGKAKAESRAVVLITDDGKEDWWQRFQGKTIGPRPELMEEFAREVGRDFYMYHPDRFLTLANGYLKREASVDAVQEIEEVRSQNLMVDSSVPLDESGWVGGNFVRDSRGLDEKLAELERARRSLWVSLAFMKDNYREATSELNLKGPVVGSEEYYSQLAERESFAHQISALTSELERVESLLSHYRYQSNLEP